MIKNLPKLNTALSKGRMFREVLFSTLSESLQVFSLISLEGSNSQLYAVYNQSQQA